MGTGRGPSVHAAARSAPAGCRPRKGPEAGRRAAWRVQTSAPPAQIGGSRLSSFEDIAPTLAELEGFRRPWFVCGGWAIDLLVGEVTREHEDIEIGVFRHHQRALRRHYADWQAFKVARAGVWDPWTEDEHLELPVHQILLRPPGAGPPPDPWEPAYEERQFFLNDAERGIWVCRRDPRVTLHVRQLALRAPSGVPVVAPEVQLLYKARHLGDKDEHDFRLVSGLLGRTRRRWLREALELIHPGHRWIQGLA